MARNCRSYRWAAARVRSGTRADATHPLLEYAGPGGFDRALADVPCSGLGTLRRNPDSRWRVTPSDPERLAKIQLSILKNTAAVLRPGGVLVYSTCTFLPEENEEIVQSFLEDSKNFALTPAGDLPPEVRNVVDRQGWMRCAPHRHDTDGFFAARFRRTS